MCWTRQEALLRTFKLIVHGTQVDFPVWFNADIVPGPGSSDGLVDLTLSVLGIDDDGDTGDNGPVPWSSMLPRAIDPERFLPLVGEYFPTSTLSTGWTTGTPAEGEEYKYTQGEDVELSVLKAAQCMYTMY